LHAVMYILEPANYMLPHRPVQASFPERLPVMNQFHARGGAGVDERTQLLNMLLLLGIIIVSSKAAASLSNRLGQPAVLGELLVGLILGPTFLNILGLPLFAGESIWVMVKNLAELGVIFLMFLAGLETELDDLKRVGLAATNGAIGGVVLPFAAGILLGRMFGLGWTESVFTGTILTATSVSISAQTLMELGRLRSKEGTTILGAAVIDDVLGIIILSLIIALSRPGTGGTGEVAVLLGKMALYFAAAIAVGFLAFGRIVHWVKQRIQASEAVFATAIILVLLYSWSAEALASIAAITGAYIAGIIFAQTSFRHFLEERMKIVAYGFFVPVFFVSIGLEANARTLGGSLLFTVLIVIAAILTKIVGAAGGAWIARFKPLEALRVGTGMVSRGEVALIVANVGLSAGIITRDIFSIMVIMTLVTTLITPIALRGLFPRGEPEPAGEQGSGEGGAGDGSAGTGTPGRGSAGTTGGGKPRKTRQGAAVPTDEPSPGRRRVSP